MNGIQLVLSFCDVVVRSLDRSITWARCLPVATAESG